MNIVSLITAAVKLINAVIGFFRDQQLIEVGKAESDARHAKAADEADARMKAIAENPPSDEELLRRLNDGTA
jgi:hypothetical protein